MNVIDPVNLVESVSPNVNSPFWFCSVVVGSKDMETMSDVILPWLKRLSVTVGMGAPLSGDKVPTVKSTGPILGNKCVKCDSKRRALTSPEDTVDTIEASGAGSNTYGLLGNNEPRGKRHSVQELGA